MFHWISIFILHHHSKSKIHECGILFLMMILFTRWNPLIRKQQYIDFILIPNKDAGMTHHMYAYIYIATEKEKRVRERERKKMSKPRSLCLFSPDVRAFSRKEEKKKSIPGTRKWIFQAWLGNFLSRPREDYVYLVVQRELWGKLFENERTISSVRTWFFSPEKKKEESSRKELLK